VTDQGVWSTDLTWVIFFSMVSEIATLGGGYEGEDGHDDDDGYCDN